MDHLDRYDGVIYRRYQDIKTAGVEPDNVNMCKIFEYYICIKLSRAYNRAFYEYGDIDSTFREDNGMSKNDTGIDACDMMDTIVQFL